MYKGLIFIPHEKTISGTGKERGWW